MLFWDFAQFYAQSIGNTFTIGLVSLQTVADMPDFDFLRCIAYITSGVFKKHFLLLGFHQAEELSRLGIVVIIILTEIPAVSSSFQFERRFGKIRLLLPVAIAVGFVTRSATLIAVNPHQTIAMEAVNRAAGSINRDEVMIDSQTVTLGITVGEKPALQHLIRRETDTRHDIGRIESRLFNIGKIVFRIAVKFQDTYLNQGIILVIPDLGQVKGIVRHFGGIFFRHDLEIHRPAGIITFLDAFIQVTLMAFAVFGYYCFGFFISQVLDALLCFQVELDPEPLVLGIDEAEGMAAESMHMAVRIRNTAVTHDDGHLVQRFRERGAEVPLILGTSHIGAGVSLDSMVEVRKLERVAQEEDGCIIADQVPVAFFGVELHGKAADITLGIGSTAFTGHGGKANKEVGLFTHSGKYFGFGIPGNIVGDSEGTKGAGTFGVHTPFRDNLTVKMAKFFQEPDIL